MKAFIRFLRTWAGYHKALFLALICGFGFPIISHSQPQIEKQPVDLFGVPLDGEASFSVQAIGDNLEYQWRRNGMNLPGATDSVLRLTKLRVDQFGTYTVAVTDEKGSVNSAPARLVPELRSVGGGDQLAESIELDPKNQWDPFAGILLTDNREATPEPGEPDHAGRKGGKSIWFRWTAPESGAVKFTAGGSGFDTLLAAYLGESVDKLRPISLTASDDDRGGFFTSEIQFNAVEGETYAIAVDGFEGASGHIILRWLLDSGRLPDLLLEPRPQVVGPGEQVQFLVDYEGGTAQWFRDDQPTEVTEKRLVIDKADEETVGRYSVLISAQERHKVRTVPANLQINLTDDRPDTNAFAHDKFLLAAEDRTKEGSNGKGPIVAGSASRGYTTTQIFSTVGSTKDPGEPNHAGVAGGASEWFVYSPPESGTLNVNTDGSNYDTVVAVYTGSGFGYASLTLVGAQNNPGVNGRDRVRFETAAGVTYFIAVDGVGGATGTVKLNIHLGNPPVISSQPQNRTVGVGTNATFSVSASGTPAPSYQWYFNGAVIPNATAASYTRLGARTNHAGDYRVLVSNSVQAVFSSTVSLSVLIPPAITNQPSHQNVPPGTDVTFSVGAEGSAPLRYQWKRDGTNLLNETNATLSLTAVQWSEAGSYSVTVTNTVGAATSDTATLTIESAAPIITAQPVSRTVGLDESVTLFVVASGSPIPTYQWSKNGISIPGATDTSLPFAKFTGADEGTYSVVVSNILGTVTSDAAKLALHSPPRTTSFSRGTNGAFEISFIGEANTTYVLEGTTNLVEWIPVATNSSPSGFVDLTDTNAVGSSLRFYRVVGE